MKLLKKTFEVHSPVKGVCMKLEDVNDPMFADKVLGDGFAVSPMSSIVKSPMEGTIVMFSEDAYAFGIENSQGATVLVHIGIDTVNLKGKGFKALKQEGQTVRVGEPVVEMDLDMLKETGYDLTTMIVFTTGEKIRSINKINEIVDNDDVILTI